MSSIRKLIIFLILLAWKCATPFLSSSNDDNGNTSKTDRLADSACPHPHAPSVHSDCQGGQTFLQLAHETSVVHVHMSGRLYCSRTGTVTNRLPRVLALTSATVFSILFTLRLKQESVPEGRITAPFAPFD